MCMTRTPAAQACSQSDLGKRPCNASRAKVDAASSIASTSANVCGWAAKSICSASAASEPARLSFTLRPRAGGEKSGAFPYSQRARWLARPSELLFTRSCAGLPRVVVEVPWTRYGESIGCEDTLCTMLGVSSVVMKQPSDVCLVKLRSWLSESAQAPLRCGEATFRSRAGLSICAGRVCPSSADFEGASSSAWLSSPEYMLGSEQGSAEVPVPVELCTPRSAKAQLLQEGARASAELPPFSLLSRE
mmetsp:Transcript_85795/g.205625  ORF Transcript_85795/g.205625 Transcript_85795/m.205625 type:complete len:247 (+) Transcript_85795:1348-2088(+)